MAVRKKYRSGTLIFLMLLILATSGNSGFVLADERIEYAYPDQSVWTTHLDENGIVKNPLHTLANQLFTAADIDWYATPYPANRLFQRLKNGSSQFSMLVRASSLSDCCLFSEKPVTHTELRVYRGHADEPISNYKEFAGKRVAVILGYSYGSIGKFIRDPANNVALFEPSTHRSAFLMLKLGRVDYVLDYRDPSEEMISEIPVLGTDYDVLVRLDVYMVLNKKQPDVKALMKKLENIAESLDIERILSQK